MTFQLFINSKVSKDISNLCLLFADYLIQNFSLEHNLHVYLHPKYEIPTRKGPALGFFTPGKTPQSSLLVNKRIK